MRITFTLSDEQFTANDRAGIMVGLPLAVQLDAGLVAAERDEPAGWVARLNHGQRALRMVSLDRCAFCGQIDQVETWDSEGETLAQVLLNCRAPLRFDVLVTGLTPLRAGDWLMGVADLRGLVALQRADLIWLPLTGAIVDIQRLCLDPNNPSFGTMRWLSGLPRQSYAPDQVFVTVEIANK